MGLYAQVSFQYPLFPSSTQKKNSSHSQPATALKGVNPHQQRGGCCCCPYCAGWKGRSQTRNSAQQQRTIEVCWRELKAQSRSLIR